MSLATLSFGGDLEAVFRAHYNKSSLTQVRVAMLLGPTLYVLFGILDHVSVRGVRDALWLIRYGYVAPILVIVFVFSLSRWFERWMQPALAIYLWVGGVGLVSMIPIGEQVGNDTYFAGSMLMFMYAYTLLRLRFVWASLIAGLLIVYYEGLALWLGEPGSALLTNNFFLISANLIGMAACYLTEYQLRREFLQSQQLERERVALKRHKESLDDMVQERTAELVRTNTQLEQEIVEREMAVEQSERLSAQLVQAQKMEAVGRLAGGIAHDFNNLLTVIMAAGEYLDHSMDETDSRQQDVDDLLTATHRAASLTQQLLAFSRKQVIEPHNIDLNEVCAGAKKMLGRLIGEDVTLTFLQNAALNLVRDDRHQIEQVLVNLAVNARDAMPAGGTLSICASNCSLDSTFCEDNTGAIPGDYVRLIIRDNGDGMDDETRMQVFEPFFTTKPVGKGSGLGLSTVYGIAKQNHGFVTVESTPGEGTAFSFYLPAVGGEPELPPTKVTRHRNGHETILVVEDENQVRRAVERILGRYGYQVLSTGDPNEAIVLCTSHGGQIDLLVTDVVMPGMNGRDLHRTVALERPKTGVLYISGYTDDVLGHHGVLGEEIDFVQKPFTAEALITGVRCALERPEV